MKKLKIYIVAIAALSLGMLACKKDNNPNNINNAGPEAGEFQVRMTDAPGDFEALDVEIVKVEAYLENEGWITLNNETQFVSVMELTNGAETELASQSNVEAGAYTKVKLTFGSQNRLTTNAHGSLESEPISAEASLNFDLKYAGPSEIIIEIDEEVTAESGASVLLDFQVMQSIKKDAEDYILNPVITFIKNESTGVKGKVEGSAQAAILITNGSDSLSTFIDAEGNFLLRGIDEGMYDMILIPETDDEMPNDETVLEGLVISQGEFYNAGTIQL